jgi:hypothetical protein
MARTPLHSATSRDHPSRDRRPGSTPPSIYADHFTPDELARIIGALDDPTGDLTGAIQATHIILDRILNRLNDETDPDRWIALSRTWGDTTHRLASLMRTNRVLTDEAADSLAGHIAAALDEVAAALGTDL